MAPSDVPPAPAAVPAHRRPTYPTYQPQPLERFVNHTTPFSRASPQTRDHHAHGYHKAHRNADAHDHHQIPGNADDLPPVCVRLLCRSSAVPPTSQSSSLCVPQTRCHPLRVTQCLVGLRAFKYLCASPRMPHRTHSLRAPPPGVHARPTSSRREARREEPTARTTQTLPSPLKSMWNACMPMGRLYEPSTHRTAKCQQMFMHLRADHIVQARTHGSL